MSNMAVARARFSGLGSPVREKTLNPMERLLVACKLARTAERRQITYEDFLRSGL